MSATLFHVATPAEFELAQLAGAGELALLEFELRSVGQVRLEAAPGASERFPHVFGPLPMRALRRSFALAPRCSNDFRGAAR